MRRRNRRQLTRAERTPLGQAIHTTLLTTALVCLLLFVLCHWGGRYTARPRAALGWDERRIYLPSGVSVAAEEDPLAKVFWMGVMLCPLTALAASGAAWWLGRTAMAAWLALFSGITLVFGMLWILLC